MSTGMVVVICTAILCATILLGLTIILIAHHKIKRGEHLVSVTKNDSEHGIWMTTEKQ